MTSSPEYTQPQAPVRKSRPLLTVLLVVGALIVGGLVGAGGGAIAAKTLVKPQGPSAPPAISAEFPDAARRYLPGLTVKDVAQDWLVKANKWVCKPDPDSGRKPLSGAANRMLCEKPTNDSIYAYIEYDAEDQIRQIDMSCHFPPGSLTCSSYFSLLAHTVLFDQPALSKQGEAWGKANADKDIETVIGEVQFIVELSPHRIVCVRAF